jgi:ribonuclease HI
MSTAPHQAAAILQTLATALPGDLLTQWFPEQSGQEIRQILQETAAQLKGTDSPAPSIPLEPPVTKPLPTVTAAGAGRLTLFSDGASRGNPGLAGAGIQILDHAKNEILAASKFLGQCTNNEAEYQALLFGLQEARRLGGKSINIFLDSELIVRQISGRYQVKNERLKALFAQVKKELAHFSPHQTRHVPRAQNQRADQMANRAIDER